MQIEDAQAEIRRGYMDGALGVIVSGCVWLATAITERQAGVGTAFTVLFFGGMFIFPIGLLIARGILKRPGESADNPMGRLVLEGTIAMIAMLAAAWLFLDYRPDWVIPIAAVAVGTHYFAFRTAYGLKIYWLLAAIVTAIGCFAIFPKLIPSDMVAFGVAATELIFGVFLAIRARG